MAVRPHRQGGLDGLCGLYAAVNAVDFLFQIRPPPGFSEDLFQVVSRAVPRSSWPRVLWDGLSMTQMRRVLASVSAHLDEEIGFGIEVARPFAQSTFRSRADFLDAARERMIARYSVLILFIEWPGDGGAHWSVLREIGSDRLRLYDSDGVAHLPLANLRVNGDRGTRIDVSRTLMLTLASIHGEKIS